MCAAEGGSGCGEGCKTVAERLDCHTPDCRVWLDSVCPTKQVRALLLAVMIIGRLLSLPAMQRVVWAVVGLLWMLHNGRLLQECVL